MIGILLAAAAALTLAPAIVTLVVSVLQPLAVAAITHVNAAPPVKVLANGVLSAAVGLVTAATTVDGSATITGTAALTALVGFVTSTVFYDTVWSRLGVAGRLLPTIGFGARDGAA